MKLVGYNRIARYITESENGWRCTARTARQYARRKPEAHPLPTTLRGRERAALAADVDQWLLEESARRTARAQAA